MSNYRNPWTGSDPRIIESRNVPSRRARHELVREFIPVEVQFCEIARKQHNSTRGASPSSNTLLHLTL